MMIDEVNNISTAPSAETESNWVGYLLNQAALKIRTLTAMTLSPLKITPPQLRALEAIAQEQPLSQTRLGELVNMDRSTIVHVVDHFEALGIASREIDRSDRRSHAVVLTEKGEHFLVEARRRAFDIECEFLTDLSHAEREILRTLLQRLFRPSPCPTEKKHEPGPTPSNSR